MAVTLARFSQEVDVATGSLDVTYFAIFHSDDGRELKLPITQEASQAIIAFFADKKQKQAGSVMDEVRSSTGNEFMEEEDRQAVTTFGGDDEVEDDEEPDEDDDVPDSEEAVPSV